MVSEEFRIEEYIMFLLYAPPRQGVASQLHLQKELFVLSRGLEKLREKAELKGYKKGPYSELVDDALSALRDYRLVEVVHGGRISLTSEGLAKVSSEWEALPPDFRDLLSRVKGFLEELNQEELLLYIYVNYPEYVEKSDVFDRIMSRRRQIALRILSRGVVSLGMAAKLAGVSVEEMLEEAKKRGIKPFEASLEDFGLA